MKKEFVPYELAVKLKAIGFDEPCLFAFDNCSTPMRCSNLRTNEQKFNGVNYNSSTYTSQPTFSQAFRWFRGKNYYVTITPYINLYSKPFGIDIEFVHETGRMEFIHFTGDSDYFETYEEAELACLTKLIEIVETRTK